VDARDKPGHDGENNPDCAALHPGYGSHRRDSPVFTRRGSLPADKGLREFAMTDRKMIEAVIDRCYAARQKGDIETLMSAFDPDAVFELAGSKELVPAAEAARGHQAIRATMTELIAVFDFIHRDIIYMAIDGERAAVHSRVKMKFIPKDRTFTTDLIDSFHFKDGKIVELVEFADTALIKDLMSPV
jgi:ketosteroid isomerase-like protein